MKKFSSIKISRKVFFLIVFLAVVACVWALWVPNKYVVPVVMYHKVELGKTFAPDAVSPENFRWQCAYLKKRGYRVIPLDQLVSMIRDGVAARQLPRKTVVITFDDGYENNFTDAFPILKEFGYSAIFFMPIEVIGIKGYMSWEQIQEMMKTGMQFGSHSMRHLILPSLSAVEQREGIFESKRVLQQRLGFPIDYFAYPIGGFNDEIKRMVQQAGYKGALTTNRGKDRWERDVFEIKRIRLSDRDNSDFILWWKLNGYYNFFRKLKNPY
jgi:peptidoglycan/xylan/chitin deacetylase (PgdA/CDA1 family)